MKTKQKKILQGLQDLAKLFLLTPFAFRANKLDQIKTDCGFYVVAGCLCQR